MGHRGSFCNGCASAMRGDNNVVADVDEALVWRPTARVV